MLDISLAAKAAGYLVSMVPCQSYLDESSGGFSTSLLLSYRDWHAEFGYHGDNGYAYLLAAAPPATFDLVTVQLYETWSRADQAALACAHQSTCRAAYLYRWAARMVRGWEVDFGTAMGRVRGRRLVRVAPSQLILGLSRGGADGKSAFFWPSEVRAAFAAATSRERPRGVAFWNIAEEGGGANRTATPLCEGSHSFAHCLDDFLKTRVPAEEYSRRR